MNVARTGHARVSGLREPCRHGGGIERPVQLAPAVVVAQHRHALAIERFQRIVEIDEYAGEIRYACLRQHGQREIAQMTVVALEQYKSHRHEAAAVGAG